MLVAPKEDHNQLIIFSVISVLSIVPMALYARAVRKRLGGASARKGVSPTY